ncbi:MAG: hypothetical protein AAF221_13765 [Pseudomonadota bacterium]
MLHKGLGARLVAGALLCFSASAHADGNTGEFLTFKDPPMASDPLAAARLENIAERKLAPFEDRLSVGAPTPLGLFTPRSTGSELSLIAPGPDAAEGGDTFGLSLVSRPITVSGVSPAAAFLESDDNDLAYNLGVNLDFARFQVGAALTRMNDTDYEFGITGLGVDMRYLGEGWETSLALTGSQATELGLTSLGRSLGMVHDQSYAVEWGASYLLTPRLSLGGSLRLSGFKDEAIFGDVSTTDSAIFLGTNLKF